MDLNQIQISESRTTLHHDESIETIKELQQYTFLETMKHGVKFITIEPALFLYILANLLAGGSLFNMTFEMGCRVDLHLNDTICSNISLGLKHVGAHIAYTGVWTRLVQQTVSTIMVLCFATFSDRHKIRKPLFTIPILGEVFSCLGLILCAVFISQWPMVVYFVMALIVPAFFGGIQTVILAVYSYITDISTQEDRTFRLGFVEVVSLALTPIGPAVASVLYLKVGYYGSYSICMFFFVTALLYGHFFIKEKPSPKRVIDICVDVFNIKSVVVDMFKILIQKRLAYRRFLLIMSYICYILIKIPNKAEDLYIKYYSFESFHWNVDTYGFIFALESITHIIGLFIAITLFTKTMKLNDYVIVMISCIIKIIVGIWHVISGTNLIMFCIGPIINGFSGLYTIALRSVVTKLVNPSEIAKSQALFVIFEILYPLIFYSMYTKFSLHTQSGFYGAFFLLNTALMVISLFILLCMYLLYKHDLEHPEPELQSGHQNEMEKYENDREIEEM